MRIAPVHPQENERLQELNSLEILGSLPDESYDRIAELAAIICDVPIALISLVDRDRQWFKATFGINVRETHRDVAFCAHAILGEGVFSVPDALKDERFADNPLVTGDTAIRSYFGAPVLSPEGRPLGTVCAIDKKIRDLSPHQLKALENLAGQVTQLLRLRKELLISEKRNEELATYRTAVLNMNDGLVLQDETGAITHYNPAALRILGLTEEQLLGRTSLDPAWKAIREDGSPLPGEEHPASVVLRTGRACRDFIMGVSTPSGELRWISVNSEPLSIGQGRENCWAATIFTDFTEKKKAESSLLQAARLSSLGEMAGGIAHEINTPLAVILACTEFLRRSYEKEVPDPAATLLKVAKIEQTSLRIAHIVRSLNSFAGGAAVEASSDVLIRNIVDETLIFCQERFRAHGIDLYVSLSHEVRVSCVSSQLSQVLLNLLNNAFDAVNSLDEKWVSIQTEVEDSRVRLVVVDSGRGIPSDIVSKMLEPFFTTKPLGYGSGLGLSIARGILESIGGRLVYELRKGHTAIVMDLPVCTRGGNHGRVA